MSQINTISSLLLAAVATPFAITAIAQETPVATELKPLEVSATRQGIAVDELAHAVTVIDREQLDSQFQTSRNLGEVLAKTVPGMAPASQTLTNFNQSLRGRNLLVLIDGVPQNTNRNISRDLMNIDPANIERIEVLRGASAVYGSGAAGGVVNIITRSNDAPNSTTLGLRSSLTKLDEDGLGYRAEQHLGGGNDSYDYGVNLAWERQGAFFDADGDRIAPEPSQGDLSDTDSLSLAGKLRWFLNGSTLTLSANHFDAEQDTDYASDPAVASLPAGSVKARPISGLKLERQSRTRNSAINLSWIANQTLLGSLDTQLYYRDYHARFSPADGRTWSTWGVLGQNFQDTETMGARVGLSTELSEASLVRWGVDVSREKSEAPIATYDGNAFDNSGGLVFINTGDRTFMPPITQDTVGTFVQLEHGFSDRLRGELGARYEYASAEFDDFTTLGQGNGIEGGEISFDDFLFNTGLVFDVTRTSELYANFSQGFELPDVGLQLRYAPSDFDITSSQLKPIKTDNYEIGTRSDWGRTQTSVAVFYSRSDLGQPTIKDFAFVQPRAKERIYGIEATLDYLISENWLLGGLVTWLEGERYDDDDQRWEALNGYRIPPVQARTYAEYTPNNHWFHRLQINYSGSRDDAFEDQVGFGSREVESYTTVDYHTRYQINQHKVSVGVENLLNENYFTVYGQLLRNNNNTSHIPASGITLMATYQYQW
ncbi:TonB-dependent receptor [Marinobacter salexigens]|uniref:TonB-dependent receptor n=1 Tax=Marinobacter salexigens TaxID=1925763 RepID=A0ABS6A4B5_9GAMM|nr:TonB-dependent receptor [Marinobacter salexigens]MBU2873015.1 TonB-dependent receptor [Marinobacter salexigens]